MTEKRGKGRPKLAKKNKRKTLNISLYWYHLDIIDSLVPYFGDRSGVIRQLIMHYVGSEEHASLRHYEEKEFLRLEKIVERLKLEKEKRRIELELEAEKTKEAIKAKAEAKYVKGKPTVFPES